MSNNDSNEEMEKKAELDDDEIIIPFKVDEHTDLKSKVKCNNFMEAWLNNKFLYDKLEIENTKAVNKFISDEISKVKTNIGEGKIQIKQNTKNFLEILESKKTSKKYDFDELMKNQYLKEMTELYENTKQTQSKQEDYIELLEKIKKINSKTIPKSEKNKLDLKIKEEKDKLEVINQKEIFLENYIDEYKERMEFFKNNPKYEVKNKKDIYLKNFNNKLSENKENVKRWQKLRHESHEHFIKNTTKIQEAANKLVEKLREQENIKEEERQKYKDDLKELVEKHREKTKSIEEEVKKMDVEKYQKPKNEYYYIKLQEELEEKSKEEVEKIKEKLNELKRSNMKSNLPTKLEYEEFNDKCEKKKEEFYLKFYKEREKILQKLFGDKYDPKLHNFGLIGEEHIPTINNEFNIDLSDAIQSNILSNIKQRDIDEKKRKSEEKLLKIKIKENKEKYIKETKLPEIDSNKQKEIKERSTKKIGLHLKNSLCNDKEFDQKKKKMKDYIDKYNKIKDEILSNVIERRLKNEKELKDKESILENNTKNNLNNTEIIKKTSGFYNDSTSYYKQFYNLNNSSINPQNTQVPNNLINSHINLAKEHDNFSANQHQNQSISKINLKKYKPIDIRKPLEKYPNYLESIQINKSTKDITVPKDKEKFLNLYDNFISKNNKLNDNLVNRKRVYKEAKNSDLNTRLDTEIAQNYSDYIRNRLQFLSLVDKK